jgi:hypothetical protein
MFGMTLHLREGEDAIITGSGDPSLHFVSFGLTSVIFLGKRE